MLKRFIKGLFLCLFLSFINIIANAQDLTQNAAVNSYLSSMFANMELSRVPTGYLVDKAVEVADLGLYICVAVK